MYGTTKDFVFLLDDKSRILSLRYFHVMCDPLVNSLYLHVFMMTDQIVLHNSTNQIQSHFSIGMGECDIFIAICNMEWKFNIRHEDFLLIENGDLMFDAGGLL